MAAALQMDVEKWFEDYEVGGLQHTSGRTITETDLVNFAGISGDFNPMHLDVESASSGPFGQRLVYGLLVMSVATGLLVQCGVVYKLQGGFREIRKWKFIKPVFIGDTIYVEYEITKTRSIRRAGGGLISINMGIKNQRNETVMCGELVGFVLNKPSA